MIQFKTIDGLLLRDMVVAGAALLEKNREAVDALNVFPVPDGVGRHQGSGYIGNGNLHSGYPSFHDCGDTAGF